MKNSIGAAAISSLETGRIARQADGAVFASWGETTVLATVVSLKTPKPGDRFLPPDRQLPGKGVCGRAHSRRLPQARGRPSDKETLVSRLIDRPIRPLFPDGFRCDTQVVVTVLSHDLETDPDILAMVAASAALTLSGVPFMGPIGAARVGYIKGEIKVNPTIDEMKDSELDLVVAGTGEAVLMVESEARELSEEIMLDAVMAGHRAFQPVIEAIIRLAERAAKEPRELTLADKSAVEKAVLDIAGEADLRAAYAITNKQQRYGAVDAAKAKAFAALAPEGGEAKFPRDLVAEAFHDAQAKVVRWNILDDKRRIDGRDLTTVRPILAQVGVLPRTHGSALFTRGETQALVVATLGTGEDEQFIDQPGRAPTRSASCSTTTSRPIRSARPAAWARRAAAKSATASSPGARSIRCCRRRPNSPTRSASSRRSPNRTARRRWRPSAARRSL